MGGAFERESSLTGVMSTLLGLQKVLSQMHWGLPSGWRKGKRGERE